MTGGALGGRIALGDIEVDAEGRVKAAAAAPDRLEPIFDVVVRDSTAVVLAQGRQRHRPFRDASGRRRGRAAVHPRRRLSQGADRRGHCRAEAGPVDESREVVGARSNRTRGANAGTSRGSRPPAAFRDLTSHRRREVGRIPGDERQAMDCRRRRHKRRHPSRHRPTAPVAPCDDRSQASATARRSAARSALEAFRMTRRSHSSAAPGARPAAIRLDATREEPNDA